MRFWGFNRKFVGFKCLALPKQNLVPKIIVMVPCVCTKVWINWFGESSVSLVSKCNIKGLKEGISRRLKQRAISPQLKAAIEEAIKAASSSK